MTTDPEDVLEPALPEQGSDDDDETLDDAAQGVSVTSDAAADSTDETGEDDDETLDDAAQGVSVTSDATADSTDETGEIDAIGRAAGLVVRDDRPFRGIDEVERRDAHRWELDPASAEDASAAEGDPPAR